MRTAEAIVAVMWLSLAARAQQVTFQPPVSFTTQTGAISLASGDLNGDGSPDLAIANAGSSSVSIALGNGDGTFKAPVVYSLGSTCAANFTYIGDFNRDGHPDILVPCFFADALKILPGNGDGTFKTAVTVSLPQPVFGGDLLEIVNLQPAIADFDGDGYLDVILSLGDPNSGVFPSVYLLRGTANFGFQAAALVQGFNTADTLSLAAADFNGDGKPDLAVVQFATVKPISVTLTIALGRGDGTFQQASSYPAAAGFSIHAADMNGDGVADVILSGGLISTTKQSSVTGSVEVFIGKGDGTFPQASSASFSQADSIVHDVEIADLRGSGKPDVIAMLWTNINTGLGADSTSLMLLPSNGDGTFQTPVDLADLSGTAVFSLAAGDFNGDGRPDMALVSAPSSYLTGLTYKASSDVPSEIINTVDGMTASAGQVWINTTAPLSFTDTNDASFRPGPQAQDSILAAFGGGLSSQTASATTLPLSLGGVNINVKDSAGVTRAANLFYVSPKQVNYAIPAGTATGAATISIVNGATAAVATQQIVPVAPGLFAVNGIAAANVASYLPGAPTPNLSFPFQLSNGALVLNPIALDPNAQTFLFLYGTGIRHAANVTANFGSLKNQPVAYAGAQGFYVGEDQINVLIPNSLKGAGVINLTLTADGQTTNTVQIQIQ